MAPPESELGRPGESLRSACSAPDGSVAARLRPDAAESQRERRWESQRVRSQIEHEHQTIDVARAGQTVGIKVGERVREHDEVYKVKGS